MAAFSVFKMTKFIFLSVSEAIISPVRMIQSMLREEKDYKTTRVIFRYSILKGLSLSAVLCSVILLFGRQIFSLMVSGAVLRETISLMRWAVIVFMLNTIVCYYLAYFQVIDRKKYAYSVSLVLNIFSLPLFYVLARRLGSEGVWMSIAAQMAIVTVYTVLCALYLGRKNTALIDKLLVLAVTDSEEYLTYDFHIGSENAAKKAVPSFGCICNEHLSENRKSYICSLALEEIVFNLLEYQKAADEPDPNIDVHIVIYEKDKMIMSVKDCSREHDPFVKYEYSTSDDGLENLGIKIVKSFASEVKYSFIYGVNFITIILFNEA